MDNLLDSLRVSAPESSGAFTIDWSKAREAYVGLARAYPQLYLYKIFQAAVACSPCTLHIDLKKEHLEFRWSDGTPFQRSDLETLQDFLLSGKRPAAWSRACQHLASLLMLQAGRDDLHLSLSAAGLLLSLTPSGPTLSNVDEESGVRVRVQHITGARRLSTLNVWNVWIMDIFAPLSLNAAWPEFSDFRQQIWAQPMEIVLNQKPWARNWSRQQPGQLLSLEVLLASEETSPGLGIDLRTVPAISRLVRDGQIVPEPGPVSSKNSKTSAAADPFARGPILPCQAAIFLVNTDSYDKIEIVRDGLPVYSAEFVSELGLYIVMDGRQLSTDATTINVVQDECFQHLLGVAGQLVQDFFQRELSSLSTAPRDPGFLEVMFDSASVIPGARWHRASRFLEEFDTAPFPFKIRPRQNTNLLETLPPAAQNGVGPPSPSPPS